MVRKFSEYFFKSIIQRKSKGFSIAELLIYILVVGILVVVMGPRIGRLFSSLTDLRIKSSLNTWQAKIQEYALDTGVFPEKLSDLWERPQGHAGKNWKSGGYLEKGDDVPPRDSRGKEIMYSHPPQIFKDRFNNYELYSIGNQEEENADPDKFIAIGS